MATEIDGDREWNEVRFERGSDSTGVLCGDILGAKLARQQGCRADFAPGVRQAQSGRSACTPNKKMSAPISKNFKI